MTGRIVPFPSDRVPVISPNLDPRLQRLARLLSEAVDKETGLPVGEAEGMQMARRAILLIAERRAQVEPEDKDRTRWPRT